MRLAAVARTAGPALLKGRRDYQEALAAKERAAALDAKAQELRERGEGFRLYRSTRGWITEDGRPASPEMVALYEKMKEIL